MIEDDRIPSEVDMAVEKLNAISYVYRRDGSIHRDYVEEKLDYVEYIVGWLKALCERGE